MSDFNANASKQPQQTVVGSLTEMLRSGARQLIAQSVKTELQVMLEQYTHHQLPSGKHKSWSEIAICQSVPYKQPLTTSQAKFPKCIPQSLLYILLTANCLSNTVEDLFLDYIFNHF